MIRQDTWRRGEWRRRWRLCSASALICCACILARCCWAWTWFHDLNDLRRMCWFSYQQTLHVVNRANWLIDRKTGTSLNTRTKTGLSLLSRTLRLCPLFSNSGESLVNYNIKKSLYSSLDILYTCFYDWFRDFNHACRLNRHCNVKMSVVSLLHDFDYSMTFQADFSIILWYICVWSPDDVSLMIPSLFISHQIKMISCPVRRGLWLNSYRCHKLHLISLKLSVQGEMHTACELCL